MPDTPLSLKFRTPTRCQNGHFRWYFWEATFGLVSNRKWSKSPCKCATHDLGQGFNRCGPDQQFSGLQDSKGQDIFEGDVVRMAGYGDYTAEFPFIELYEASFENDIGEITGNIYVENAE